MPSAEIITIGTEILLGEIVDTNTRYIARALRGLGIDLYRTITIGDNVERIAQAINASTQQADIIITTGGLGPTVDDPTREAVARAFGVGTEFCQELWEQVLEIISRYGRKPNENQKRQAYLPAGALAIRNPVGTAPAFLMEFSTPQVEKGCVISLPGVPKEMEHLLGTAVIPYLQKRYHLNKIIKVRLLRTAGAPEADVDEKIDEFERLSNPTVGLAAHTGIVDIRIAAKASTLAEADRMIAEVESKIRARLGEVIFGADDDTLEDAALRAASSQGWNLVALESGLGGSLARRLAGVQTQNLVAVKTIETQAGELSTTMKIFQAENNARAALGIAAFPQEKIVEMVLATPVEVMERRLPFGGHPDLMPRWAINLALNWLRKTANKNDA